ncbi:unnamed protein product [Clavelina lepadiformis]|uniref:Carbohydrate sulfotransferase n=1 Tax=Clavelina lepadiformis TaxID=159417 RepID=A0ABP0GWR1_CLALP
MEGHYTVEDYFIEGKFQHEGPKIFHIGWVEMNLWHMKNKTEQQKTWKKAFKVIMVRHPFDRMVSAYVNRLKYGAPGFGASFKILSYKLNAKYRHLRHIVEDRNKTDDGTSTFEDFVNYLVDSDGGKDPYFSFYHTRCSVCTFVTSTMITSSNLKPCERTSSIYKTILIFHNNIGEYYSLKLSN